MNMRERLLAFAQRRELDRVPFAHYSWMAGVPNEEVWALVGRDNLGLLQGATAHRFEHPNCTFHSEEFYLQGIRGIRTTLVTPEGQLTEESLIEPTFGTGAKHKHYIQNVDDYRIFMAYLRDITVHEHYEPLYQAIKNLGDDGILHTWIGRTPFQQLWIQWVNIQDLCVHLVDHPEVLDECMELLGRVMRMIFHAVRNAPIPYAVIGDNITAPVIGETLFRKYCVPYYDELADLLAERNIPVFVHADGDLKPLWKAFGESKVRGFDSFSPTPDNDTTPAEAIAIHPELRVGMNFPSSVHLSTPEVIRETAERILEEAGHSGRLQFQISENMPPGCWRKSYPEIVSAIARFGKPFSYTH